MLRWLLPTALTLVEASWLVPWAVLFGIWGMDARSRRRSAWSHSSWPVGQPRPAHDARSDGPSLRRSHRGWRRWRRS